jgi:hypothetical protein
MHQSSARVRPEGLRPPMHRLEDRRCTSSKTWAGGAGSSGAAGRTKWALPCHTPQEEKRALPCDTTWRNGVVAAWS